MLIEDTRKGMGTKLAIHLAVAPEQADAAQGVIDACFDWLAEVERRLTRFDDASDLCQMNAASGRWQPVSEMLFTVVEQALLAAKASDGLFDPTLLPLVETLGYDRDFKTIAHREISSVPPANQWVNEDMQRQRSGAWRDIRLDAARRCVFLPRGIRLDLGGIAKGWAADLALERFFADYPNVILDLGGDMRVRGERSAGEPWPIGIGFPRTVTGQSEPEQTVITMRRSAVATSGATDRWWLRNGQLLHHLLDPRTGKPAASIWIDASGQEVEGPAHNQPATMIASATALASTVAHAEIAAKVALLRGFPLATQAVEAAWTDHSEDVEASALDMAPYTDAGVAIVLIMGDGAVICSANLQDYLNTLGGGGDIWLS